MKNILLFITCVFTTFAFATGVKNSAEAWAVKMCVNSVPDTAAMACIGVKSTAEANAVKTCVDIIPNAAAAACGQ